MLQKGLTFDLSEQTSQSSVKEKKMSEILLSTRDSLDAVARRPSRILSNTCKGGK